MIIDLCWAEGVIIPCRSGVIYTQQVGGIACLHPEVEGVFVPLCSFKGDRDKLMEGLSKIFYDKYECHCYKGITEEDADYLDKVFRKAKYPFKVDREKLRESVEAWLYIVITRDVVTYDVPWITGIKGKKGILTWQNSD